MRNHQLAVVLILAVPSFALVAGAARPQTPAPAPLQVPAGFDIAFAMNALFGNYDPASGTSSSAAPLTGMENSEFQPGQKVDVRPYFAATSSITGEVFLATFAVPAEGASGCHACEPLVGAAAFAKSGEAWKVEASEKPDIIFGQYGAPAAAQLFQFGPHHSGIKLSDTNGNQGAVGTYLILLVPWNGGFSQAYSGFVAESNTDECTERAAPCFSYQSVLKFVTGSNPEYYDIVFKTSGTDLASGSPGGVKNVTSVKRLRFADGKYVAADAH